MPGMGDPAAQQARAGWRGYQGGGQRPKKPKKDKKKKGFGQL
jgi:signal recognition particle subunit SRP54